MLPQIRKLSCFEQQNDTERRRAVTIIDAPSTARPPLRIPPARIAGSEQNISVRYEDHCRIRNTRWIIPTGVSYL